MYICSIGKLNEESVSSGSEWVQISTRNDEYSKGTNEMNSTKVNDIKDKVNTPMQTYIHKRIFIELVHGGAWHDTLHILG